MGWRGRIGSYIIILKPVDADILFFSFSTLYIFRKGVSLYVVILMGEFMFRECQSNFSHAFDMRKAAMMSDDLSYSELCIFFCV